jgi:hypothetical protein
LANYARLSLSLEVSESSDYSNPLLKPYIPALELTPDEYEWRVVEATTTGATVELGMYTTITTLIVYNADSAIDVCAVFTNVGGHVATAASTAHDIAPGRFVVLTDVAAASDLVLDSESGTPRCYVGVLGT